MTQPILMIDNFDSFVYNLARYLTELHQQVIVVRNDQITDDLCERYNPKAIVISPGPGSPSDIEAVNALIRRNTKPLLGVCLGHQCIGQVEGGTIIRAPKPVHGKTAMVYHDQQGLFEGIPNPVQVMRYHSLVIDPQTLPDALKTTAFIDDDLIMGIEHKEKPIYGVQFHPESISTDHGHQMLANFIRIADNFHPTT